MDSVKKNLMLLAVSHFCGLTILLANTTIANVIGKTIVTAGNFDRGFSTFPYGFMNAAVSLIIAPAGFGMSRYGHKKVFIFGTVIGFIGSLICIGSLFCSPLNMMILFTTGLTFQGCAYGIMNFYRHVAANMGGMDDEGIKSWYVSIVISTGAVAGVVGPAIISVSKAAYGAYAYHASIAALSVVYIIHTVLLYYTTFDVKQPCSMVAKKPRPLLTIVRNPNYLHAFFTGVITHSLMLLLMGITPTLFSGEISLFYISLVIQLHAVCMFFPSFFTSKLIAKYGGQWVAVVSYLIGTVGSAVYLVQDGHIWHQYAAAMVSLVLIGIAWNLGFVSATTLLCETYSSNEKYKAQSFNDTFVFGLGAVFSVMAGAFLSAGGQTLIVSFSIVLSGIMAIANVVFLTTYKRYRSQMVKISSGRKSSEIYMIGYSFPPDSKDDEDRAFSRIVYAF